MSLPSLSAPDSMVDALGEFLEVFVHSVLCTRKVYPESLFESRFAYGIPVKASRHPELNRYISNAVSAIKVELAKDREPGDAMVNIVDGRGAPIESFVLEMSAIGSTYDSRQDVELRAALIRLGTLDAAELPQDATFHICYRGREGETPSLEKNEWVPQIQDDAAEQQCAGRTRQQLVPLTSVSGAGLKAQAFALLRRAD